ncbi:MAG TPA: 2-oxoglutarate dehydrogenase E1 component, partial [Opitutaceae bacterium]|nr:2-oxoglutarate dehydrogenase E1 component [Opitutaceae bacterium]
MNRPSLPTHANVSVIEAAYEAWQKDPNSVDPTWRAFFQGFTLGTNGATPGAALATAAENESHAHAAAPIIDSLKQSRVHHLINTYRSIGHFEAHLDPLSEPPSAHPKLSLAAFELGEADLDTAFDVGTYLGGGQMKLRD